MAAVSKLPLELAAGEKDLLYSIYVALGGNPAVITKAPLELAAGEKDLLYSIYLGLGGT